MMEIRCHHCDSTGTVVTRHRCPDCDGHPAQFGECARCSTEGWLSVAAPCRACKARGAAAVEYA